MKPALLFLAHRIPYPPDKGDKIRSWNLLRHLSQSFRIYLGTFIDDPRDWQFTGVLDEVCEECKFIALDPRFAKLRSLSGFITGRALSEPYYQNSDLHEWVETTVKQNGIEHLVVYSSPMAQYVSGSEFDHCTRVIDFVDMDSDKWRQYAALKRWPLNWVYRREATRLLHFERGIAKQFNASLFVSEAEADLFRNHAQESRQRISHYNNGVDIDYFDPSIGFENPYSPDSEILVFTGAMDYWPNVDAVKWFAEQVWPILRKSRPQLQFFVVGSKPTADVTALAAIDGITVTGRVEDIRPYIACANVAIAPLRVARGIQNKVLEAMAMAVPVVVSPQGLEGIPARHEQEVLVAKSADEYRNWIIALLDNQFAELADAGRSFVHNNFTWSQSLPRVTQLLTDKSMIMEALCEH